MVIITCIDDSNGILFNNRRVSSDRILNQWVIDYIGGHKLWLREYSKILFEQYSNIEVCDDYLDKAGKGDFCFVEDGKLANYEEKVEKLIVCKWNRRYPSDVKLPELFSSKCNNKSVITEFEGSSHDKITVEEWCK